LFKNKQIEEVVCGVEGSGVVIGRRGGGAVWWVGARNNTIIKSGKMREKREFPPFSSRL